MLDSNKFLKMYDWYLSGSLSTCVASRHSFAFGLKVLLIKSFALHLQKKEI
jgi:hypothetical protein